MEKRITIDGVTFSYIIKRSTKRKIYIRVKDGVVKVSCTKKTTTQEIERLLGVHIEFIKKQLFFSKKEDIIHLNGIAYRPRFLVGNKPHVEICGDEIHLYSKTGEMSSYKSILYSFYKEEVERELLKLMSEAYYDFSDIKFPTISVRYMKSMYGNYHKAKHHIKLSSILAKYDYKYIKFILYHELCHVTQFNHSNEFFALYDLKYHGAKEERKIFKEIKYNDYL